ncbi:GD16240 [Drosophila simulans]|uniref:GD16240 n=1 Tax=Drosophila simulans TaxID=7240 RepID=B4R518_DROSI|nr:GD16240 [Drosophila simulans]
MAHSTQSGAAQALNGQHPELAFADADADTDVDERNEQEQSSISYWALCPGSIPQRATQCGSAAFEDGQRKGAGVSDALAGGLCAGTSTQFDIHALGH